MGAVTWGIGEGDSQQSAEIFKEANEDKRYSRREGRAHIDKDGQLLTD